MLSLNKVIIAGNITRDVELRQVGDTCVCSLNVACNESYKTKGGEKVDTTVFVQCEVWGKSAEACDKYLVKGSPVLVEGRLKLDTWEKDGEKRSMLRVRSDRVQFLSSGKKEKAEEAPEPTEGW